MGPAMPSGESGHRYGRHSGPRRSPMESWMPPCASKSAKNASAVRDHYRRTKVVHKGTAWRSAIVSAAIFVGLAGAGQTQAFNPAPARPNSAASRHIAPVDWVDPYIGTKGSAQL